MMDKLKDFFKKNKSLVMITSIVLVLIIVMSIFWINRGTFSLLEDEDGITLECNINGLNADDTIECQVLLYSPNTTTLSVNANYEFSDNVIYTGFEVPECEEENCFTAFANSENGFAVGNVVGYHDSDYPLLVGTLSLKLESDIDDIENLVIKLTNVELSDSEFEMHELDDVVASFDIKSSDASISGGEVHLINCETDSECLNVATSVPTITDLVEDYEISVPSDVNQILIIIDTSDINATVTGNDVAFTRYLDCDSDDWIDGTKPSNCEDLHHTLGKFNLHYGVNVINVSVLAEDEITEKHYMFTIERDYDFMTDAYLYNEEENYLYIGADPIQSVVTNLEMLEDDTHYNINDNKLEIMYGNAVLKSIDIVNFQSDYTVSEKTIFVGEEINYNTLFSHIHSSTLSFVAIDESNNVITDDDEIIYRGDKINIYYLDNLIDTLNIDIAEMLVIDSNLNIDTPKSMIKRIKVGRDVEWLKSMIDTSGLVEVYSDDDVLSDDDILKTGDILRITFDDRVVNYTLSVLGDVNGDGKILINDVALLYGHLKGRRTGDNALIPAEIEAGDANGNNSILINDVALIYQYVKGNEGVLDD